ncbi:MULTISPECIES: hypothetical protein [unclassified Caballeronia]|uniref:hypothetical protein n=1 Tax=unclassified Caballeronia TaxID=2646786 RepID=UPI00202934F0|nr:MULTISPECIES: hypothetical protein [unclassified Caballeronia]
MRINIARSSVPGVMPGCAPFRRLQYLSKQPICIGERFVCHRANRALRMRRCNEVLEPAEKAKLSVDVSTPPMVSKGASQFPYQRIGHSAQ